MHRATILAVLLTASAAIAHQGVQNPAVKARMHAMGVIGENTKLLGEMVKGAVPFDADKARAAAGVIADHAATVPALFEAQEGDPKSEALPMIWENFDDFTIKAETLQTVAQNAAMGIETTEDALAALKEIGSACKGCHAIYRE